MQGASSQQLRIFLSSAAEDGEFAGRLRRDLEAAGAQIRYPRLLPASPPGEHAPESASAALAESDWVVVVLTLAAIALPSVQSEVASALQGRTQGPARGIILVLAQPLDPATIPSLWVALERIDATQDYQAALAWLLARLRLNLPMSSVALESETLRGWDGTLRDVAPDTAEPHPAKEEAPAPESEAAAAPPPAWDTDEIVRGWDDTPTVIAPRGQDAPPPAPAAEPPAPAAPSPAAPPPLGASEPDRAPAPGFGQPPAPDKLFDRLGSQGKPTPPAPGYPGYPQAPAPAPSYPPYPPSQGYAPPPAYGAPPNPIAPAPQGGYGYPGPFSPWPAPPASPVATAEQVMFTAYHVREIAPQAWEPLYVYIALDTPQAQAQVQAAAQQVLAGRISEFRPAVAAETSWLRRGTQLTFVPSVPGCVFNPPEQTVPWQADVQQLAFGMQAVSAPPGYAVNGSVQVFTGPLLRADIPISVFVRQPGIYAPAPQQQRTFATAVARAYRRVFASYSHRDTAVVQSCETAAQVTGDRYLRDVTLLRSGEQWNDRLLQAIGEADLFQLFWSENAARSPAVQTEWRHALALQPVRGNFIRPVYWSRQVYPIPPELQAIHFERLSLARLGWGKVRIFLHDNLGIG